VIELVRNRLHVGRFELLGIEHDRQRIAGEATGGEHIKGDETPANEVPRPLPPSACRLLRREINRRHHIRWATKS
jgi:hypothetical protein